MFTGIIENTGRVAALRKRGGGIVLTIRPAAAMEWRTGDSVSVNGVCLTVVDDAADVSFEVSPETMKSTTLGELRKDDRVNLERALRPTDRIGGHIVTGHVDGVGTVAERRTSGDYTFYTLEAPPGILRYTVQKGSIAVDGISLTVVDLSQGTVSVAVIPHTLSETNISDRKVRDRVNIEADIIGKYVEKFVSRQGSDGRLMELLREKGFAE